jgi:hypothetical protein
MGLFANTKSINESMMDYDLKNPDELGEAFILDELSFLSDEDKQAFAESAVCEELIQEGLLKRQSVVRLTKNDDLTRRTKLAAFQLAKERNDPLWGMLVKNRVKEKALIGKIVQKYHSQAGRTAVKAQRTYVKGKLPISMMRPTKMQ